MIVRKNCVSNGIETDWNSKIDSLELEAMETCCQACVHVVFF